MSSSPATAAATFTSTTAPGVIFTSRQDLAEHYKSDWHSYNLKRRQAGLPFLLQHDFQARLQAAQALRLEKERAAAVAGKSHLKNKDKKQNKNIKSSIIHKDNHDGVGVGMVSQCAAYDNIIKEQKTTDEQQQQQQAMKETVETETSLADSAGNTAVTAPSNVANVAHQESNDDTMMNVDPSTSATATEEDALVVLDVNNDEEKDQPDEQAQPQEEPEEIDPCQSLFDRHVSSSVAENIQYMHEKFGFFIPDAEYLQDPEGLIGYCHEKLTLGRMCLYCHKIFSAKQEKTASSSATTKSTTFAIQAHMRDAQHCKLRYESGIDLEDLLVFYDFESANQEFLSSSSSSPPHKNGTSSSKGVAANNNNNMEEEEEDGVAEKGGDEDGWEDVSDNEDGNDDVKMENEDDDEDDDYYYNDLLEQQVQRLGWNVTALGELVFPDGRIIGHRALRRYYKQRSTFRTQTAAVAAARLASRERLVMGRVVQLPPAGAGAGAHGGAGGGGGASTLAMVASSRQAMLGIPTSMAMGRGGKGILVPSNNGNNGNSNSSFTQVSLYRFRAVLRQQKRDEMRAQKLHNRTAQNMNRMDKKANRLMNNVSVAHAKR